MEVKSDGVRSVFWALVRRSVDVEDLGGKRGGEPHSLRESLTAQQDGSLRIV